MKFKQFIASLTTEDLQEINARFDKLHGKIPSYAFSEITLKKLKNIVKIKPKLNHAKFNDWFESDIFLERADTLFLENLIAKCIFYIGNYQEEDLKMKFIALLLDRVNFTNMEKEICDFYDRTLTYKTKKFILNGRTDFMVAKGHFYPEKSYFFIQEFKPSTDAKNPQPQLLAELIAAIELNQFNTIKGAFIIGTAWNFVILEKLGKHQYQYFVSRNYDSVKLEDLQDIYKNLLFVKQEIFNL